jgi:hypothetical protein
MRTLIEKSLSGNIRTKVSGETEVKDIFKMDGVGLVILLQHIQNSPHVLEILVNNLLTTIVL